MSAENLEIDQIKKNLINKINDANIDTLLALNEVFEPTKILTAKEKLLEAEKNKQYRKIPKKERIIAKELLKFMRSIAKKIEKYPSNINGDQILTFSPSDPDIKKFLDQSDVIKQDGLEIWMEKINHHGVRIIGFMTSDIYMIFENGNLCLKYDENDGV